MQRRRNKAGRTASQTRRKVYEIKAREPSKPLPVLVDSLKTAQTISAMDSRAVQIAERFWPGPLTMILDISDPRLAEPLRLGEHDGIALRVPAHECALRLLGSCKMIAGTSANMSGTESTGDPAACAHTMSGYDMILDGGVISDPAESAIIDVRGGRIVTVREGKAPGLQEMLGRL